MPLRVASRVQSAVPLESDPQSAKCPLESPGASPCGAANGERARLEPSRALAIAGDHAPRSGIGPESNNSTKYYQYTEIT